MSGAPDPMFDRVPPPSSVERALRYAREEQSIAHGWHRGTAQPGRDLASVVRLQRRRAVLLPAALERTVDGTVP